MAGSSAITMYSNSNKTHESNIAGKEVWGGKKKENLFSSSFVGSSSGGVSFVNNKTRSTNDVQGKIIGTGIASDIALDGAGMLVVSDSATGAAKYTRRGDFRQDELGFWKNGSGMLLKAWKLDPNGELPQNSSLLSSLEAVNFANTKGLPVATSVISIAMNLNADQDALRGAGVDTVLNRTGLNTGKKNDGILFPEKINNASLKLGDQYTLKSSDGQARTLTYGGLVAAKKADANTGERVFGAGGAGVSFTFNDPANGNLVAGQALTITLTNGQSYTFTVQAGAESKANKTFNTINGLAAAINTVSALAAEVDSQGRLYIAPVDPQQGLTFADVGGGQIRAQLALADLVPVVGTTYFNSLSTLRDAVNANKDVYSLSATFDGGKDLKITSALSTADFDITATSLGVNKITTVAQGAGDRGRATIFISAPGNTLVAGDYIRITNAGNANLPDGLYFVSSRTSNGFTVNSNQAPAAFPATGAGIGVIGANAVWQKTAGYTYATRQATLPNTALNGGDIVLNVANPNPGGNRVLGANDPNNANPFPENWAAGDVVYISGLGVVDDGANATVTVPDGYYQITNANVAGDPAILRVTPAANAATGGVNNIPGNFSITKISQQGGIGALDTFAFATGGGVGPNSFVRHYMPNHGYSVGDVISFDIPVLVDGIPLAANTNYKITATGAGYVDFQVFDANGAVVQATTGTLTRATSQLLSAFDVQVNSGSQLMRFFGLDPNKTHFDKKYDAANVDKNLSAAVNGRSANFASKYTYSVSLNVIDSLGSDHRLILYFAKLDKNKWAVELVAQSEDGVFDVTGLRTTNGLIRQGILKFDTDGKLAGVPEGFEGPISIQFDNGSAPSNVTIDWENTLSEIKSGTVSQTKNPNNVEIIQNDGQVAGNLTRLEVAANGDVIGTFDSGEQRALYRVPVAMVANINGMVAGSNDTFDVSRDSGDVVIKGAGVGGAAKTLGGVLEASNVDTTTELLTVQDLSNTIRANARVAAVDNENFKTILSELQ